MDPASQVLMQTSMAETQRRAQRDQMDTQIAQQKLQVDSQSDQARIKAETDKALADQNLEVAMNAEDNLTKERIESARLTRDAATLQQEQQKTALELENQAQTYLGEQHG
jgi:uncharacterized membrane protein YqiK